MKIIKEYLKYVPEEDLLSFFSEGIASIIKSIQPVLTKDCLIQSLLKIIPEEKFALDYEYRNKIIDYMPSESVVQLYQAIFDVPCFDTLDAFVTLKKLKNPSIKQRGEFKRFFKIEHEQKSIDEICVASVNPKYSLFLHQRKMIGKIREKLSRPPYKLLLHMPTGSGKTRTAMNIISGYLRDFEPCLVVWLAYSEELCEQAVEEFIKCWTSLGNRSVGVARFWGEHSESSLDLKDGFIVAGLSKLYHLLQKDEKTLLRLSKETRLLVFDEAHSVIAPTYQKITECFTEAPNCSHLLGLSATPGRTWLNIDEDEKLSDFFSRKKMSLSAPDSSNPIRYLIKEGFIAEPRFYPLESGVVFSQSELQDANENKDFSTEILNKIALDKFRTCMILREIENMVEEGHRRILLFAATVQHAKELSALLTIRGIWANSITADTPPRQRKRLLGEYNFGDLSVPRILSNFGVLTTGFDAPKTSALIIARPTKSLILYSQMVGRALRGERAGGNKTAKIVTIVDTNLPGFRNMTESFYNWEDVWS